MKRCNATFRLLGSMSCAWLLTLGTVATSEAQQVQELAQQAQQIEVNLSNINDFPQLAWDLEVEPARVVSLTPEETAEIRRTFEQLHEALTAERGDNLLAQVWDYEQATISRNKRASDPEKLKFDPNGNLSLRAWLKRQLSMETIRLWKDAEIRPVEENHDLLTVSLTGNSLMWNQITLRRVGNRYQIVGVVFYSLFC